MIRFYSAVFSNRRKPMTKIHPMALFRLTVLGQLASRDCLERGELKQILQTLAAKTYDIPGSKRCQLSEKTIESWYYAWKTGGIEALETNPRNDKGQSKLPAKIQDAILTAKWDNPSRALNTLIALLEQKGLIAHGTISRSSVHRLLKQHGLSTRSVVSTAAVERRSFVASHAGDIWYGDVMHGPKVVIDGHLRKSYLVSLMDDASRLITHSAFCAGETALDIEGVLKQAVLKRGLPIKLVVDNGAAYRSKTLQAICALLEIRLIYCKPYSPQGKGKLERWHATVRSQFLSELTACAIRDVQDLNARWWVWIEKAYHQRPHQGLGGKTPLQRWQQDLVRMRSLGHFAAPLDTIFYHRQSRKVRKDGTVAFQGTLFEVPYELSGQSVMLVVDPHRHQAIAVEDEDGKCLGPVTLLDANANAHRKRCQPQLIASTKPPATSTVEDLYQAYQASFVPTVKEDN